MRMPAALMLICGLLAGTGAWALTPAAPQRAAPPLVRSAVPHSPAAHPGSGSGATARTAAPPPAAAAPAHALPPAHAAPPKPAYHAPQQLPAQAARGMLGGAATGRIASQAARLDGSSVRRRR
jgi:hypothetical protein